MSQFLFFNGKTNFHNEIVSIINIFKNVKQQNRKILYNKNPLKRKSIKAHFCIFEIFILINTFINRKVITVAGNGLKAHLWPVYWLVIGGFT